MWMVGQISFSQLGQNITKMFFFFSIFRDNMMALKHFITLLNSLVMNVHSSCKLLDLQNHVVSYAYKSEKELGTPRKYRVCIVEKTMDPTLNLAEHHQWSVSYQMKYCNLHIGIYDNKMLCWIVSSAFINPSGYRHQISNYRLLWIFFLQNNYCRECKMILSKTKLLLVKELVFSNEIDYFVIQESLKYFWKKMWRLILVGNS